MTTQIVNTNQETSTQNPLDLALDHLEKGLIDFQAGNYSKAVALLTKSIETSASTEVEH